MLTKRTVIGIGVGSVIIAIGLYALILSIGIQTINVDETVPVAKSVTYQFTAPENSHQNFKVTGERFHIKLQTFADDIQKDDEYKNERTFDWYVTQEGINRIEIKNTGSSDLRITGQFSKNTDPLLFTYHIMVITAGIVIIGFSAAFSVRKPKGF
jgi:hypothetical protein